MNSRTLGILQTFNSSSARSASDATHAGAGADRPLPVCGIRADCRWFAQAGAAACRVCPIVRTPALPKAV